MDYTSLAIAPDILARASQSPAIKAAQNPQIEKKAQEFEALMLSELLKPMFESAKAPSLMGGEGPAQDVFGTMLHDEYAKAIAARGGIGIADQVKAALLRLQSEQQ